MGQIFIIDFAPLSMDLDVHVTAPEDSIAWRLLPRHLSWQ